MTLKAVIFDVDGTLADLPANCFEVIGAGEQATAKKPAPGIYRWVLSQLGLAGDACLAIEDSKNGFCAALGAGTPVLVTESFWTGRDDFTGAMAVLPDLEGVGLAPLEQWHAQASTWPKLKNPCNSLSYRGFNWSE